VEDLESITVTEELLPQEDYSYKKETLLKYANNISECNADFSALVNRIFIDGGEKGKIVDEMTTKTKQLEVWNTSLLLDVNYRIGQIVNRFEEQVDDMKSQQVTISYENIFVTE